MLNHDNVQMSRSGQMAGALFALRGFLRTRFGIISTAGLAIGTGLYLGWGYVLAAGLAPLILGVAPCATMCALGLCMGGSHKKSQDATNQVATGTDAGQVAKADTTKHGKGCC